MIMIVCVMIIIIIMCNDYDSVCDYNGVSVMIIMCVMCDDDNNNYVL